jgi:hypothetical protein
MLLPWKISVTACITEKRILDNKECRSHASLALVEHFENKASILAKEENFFSAREFKDIYTVHRNEKRL